MKNLILIFSSMTGVGNGYNFFESKSIKGNELPMLIESTGIVKKILNADIVIINDSSYSDLKYDASVKIILEEIKEKSTSQNVKLYIVYHKKENQNFGHENHQDDNLAKFFHEQIEQGVQQSHVQGSVFDTELKQIADSIVNNDKANYYKAIDSIINRFPDPFLESFIHLHKSLNLLPLKIKAGIITDNDFKTEIDKIKAKEEMKFAVEKFLPNGETVIPNTLKIKLTAIEDEIVKLSTTR